MTTHSPPRLAGSPHPGLITGEFPQAHLAAGVEFVGRDADLGAEAELTAVSEAGGDVVEDACGVDAAEEELGGVRTAR